MTIMLIKLIRYMEKHKANSRSYQNAIACRFLFILLCWIPLLNIVISFCIILPYWLFTGKDYFDTYHFKRINDWHSSLI